MVSNKMEADSMACPEGGICNYVWNDKLGKLMCSKCGKIALYQPVDIGKLIAEHKIFYDKVTLVENVLKGDGTPAHKLAEIQFIIEDD